MKERKFLLWTFVFLFVGYIISLFYTDKNFAVGLIFISIYLFLRAIVFSSESNMFLAVLLLIFGVLALLKIDSYSIYIFAIPFSATFTLIIFQSLLLKYMLYFSIPISLSTFLYNFSYISIWLFVAILVFCVIINIAILKLG